LKRLNQTAGAPMKCPLKTQVTSKKGNWLLPYISSSSLPMALKKDIRFSRCPKLVVQKPPEITLIKFFVIRH
jgi:hypothetical protein